jgi:hypothetical protein
MTVFGSRSPISRAAYDRDHESGRAATQLLTDQRNRAVLAVGGWRPSVPATTRHVHERCAGDGLIGPDDLIEALIEDSRFGACAGENSCFRPPW